MPKPNHKQMLSQFLDAVSPGPVQVVCDVDADGLTAGVLAAKLIRQKGLEAPRPVLPAKGEFGVTEGLLRRAEENCPKGLLVVDLPPSPALTLARCPALIVDDHVVSGE